MPAVAETVNRHLARQRQSARPYHCHWGIPTKMGEAREVRHRACTYRSDWEGILLARHDAGVD